MGRYRKEEKIRKLLDNFYIAQTMFNADKKNYVVELYCDCSLNRDGILKFYFHNLEIKQYIVMDIAVIDIIQGKLMDVKNCYFIINILFYYVKLATGWSDKE